MFTMNTQLFERHIDAASKRYDANSKERKVRKKALSVIDRPGEWKKIDDPERILWRLNSRGLNQEAAYLLENDRPPPQKPGAPKVRKNASFLERIIGENDFLGAAFLPVGAAIRCSVGRVVDRTSGLGFGTGFLVSSSLLMTNNHVLRTHNDAASSVIQFDYLAWPSGQRRSSTLFNLKPEKFFVTSVGLDYTLVAVEPVNSQGELLKNRGWSRLIETSGKTIFSDLVNIIQHPDGKPQQVSLRENQIVGKVDDFLHYKADTQRGSSGSPVYNDRWELGALHHSGVPKEDDQGRVLLINGTLWNKDPSTKHLIDWIANEGVRISSIVSDLKNRYGSFTPDQKSLFDATFEQCNMMYEEAQSKANDPVQTGNEASIDASGRVHWMVPLDISVGLGQASPSTLATTTDARNLTSASGVAMPSTEDAEVSRAIERLHDFVDKTYYDEVTDQTSYEAYYVSMPDEADADEWYHFFQDLVIQTHTTTLNYKSARLEWLYPWIDLREDECCKRGLRGIYSGKDFDPGAVITDEMRAEVRREEALREIMRTESLSSEAREERLEALEAQFPFNCEHVVPQSWFRKASPMKTDLHHLFTCEWGCNSFRSNLPYFEFVEVEEALRDQCGRRETGQGFEPVCGKGAAARATLYFLLRYPGRIGDESRELQKESIELLLAWNEQEPPDRYEFHRNAEIQKIQGNRNPLIDFSPMARSIDFSRGFGQ